MAAAPFLLIITITIAQLFLSALSLPSPRHRCRDPPEAKLQTMYAKAGGQESSLGRTKRSAPRSTPERRKHCPSTPDPYSWYLEDRSTCPWYFELDHQPSRYPQNIQQAKCKCTRCLDDGVGATGKSLCQRIILPRPVLIRTNSCVDGEWIFEVTEMSLSVGCTCALPKTSRPAPDVAPGRWCPEGMPPEMC